MSQHVLDLIDNAIAGAGGDEMRWAPGKADPPTPGSMVGDLDQVAAAVRALMEALWCAIQPALDALVACASLRAPPQPTPTRLEAFRRKARRPSRRWLRP